MDIYTGSILLGVIGLAAMALSGLGRHGHGHASSAGRGSHAVARGHVHAPAHGGGTGAMGFGVRVAGWMLMTPRLLFACLIGFGLAGTLLQHWIAGTLLLIVAIAGGVVFERIAVAPLSNFALRFASNPALTLDSAITADATAVTSFDRNGEGIVAVEVDGQVRQILASLLPADRATGVVVRAGQRVRVEEVDSARHRCRVSLL